VRTRSSRTTTGGESFSAGEKVLRWKKRKGQDKQKERKISIPTNTAVLLHQREKKKKKILWAFLVGLSVVRRGYRQKKTDRVVVDGVYQRIG